ncbi:MAG TPA: sigma-70 family RNA polymerase sigma factor [Candidatus Hydrogenedentes bacterium]|nr:sigma-70 family RNA polymerase sigma factor [Candidatus Hydrogenedentota bacterium]
MNATDISLINRWVKTRDADAFEEIVCRHSGMVYATCTRVLGSRTEAEDVTQECFIELAECAASITSSLAGWLHAAARHRSLDRIKAEKRRRKREQDFAAERPSTVDTHWTDLREHLDEAIAELPEELRAAIICRFLEGQAHEAIIDRLGISRSTVHYRLNKGLARLGQILKKRGVTFSVVALAAAMEANAIEAVPEELVAALGKLGIAGQLASGPISVTGTLALNNAFKALPGVFVMKKFVLGVFVVGCVLLGLWALTPEDSPLTSAPDKGVEKGGAATPEPPVPEPPLPAEAEASTAPRGETVAEPVGGAVAGRVYDSESGVGLGGVIITARSRVPRDGSVARVTSDEHGQFQINALEPGIYSIGPSVVPRGPRPTDLDRCVVRIDENARIADLDFPVARGLPVRGTVVNAQHQPVQGALVEARTAWRYAEQTRSDTDGAFTLWIGTPTGNLLVRAATHNLASEIHGPLAVADAGIEGLTLMLLSCAVVEGRVVDFKERPVPLASAIARQALVSTAAPFEIHRCDADERGEFRIEGLAPATYELAVSPSGTNDAKGIFQQVVRLKSGEVLRTVLRLPRAHNLSISGNVRDTSGGSIPGVTVTCQGPSAGMGAADAAGHYEITNLRSGKHLLRVSDERYCSASWNGVDAGSQGVDLILKKRASLSGRVVWRQSSAPVCDFQLVHWGGRWKTYEPWMEKHFVRFHDSEGRFQLTDVDIIADAATIFVKADCAAGPAIIVEGLCPGESRDDVVLSLEPSRTIEGSVRNLQGQPLSQALIFPAAFPGEYWAEASPIASTKKDGSFVIGQGIGAEVDSIWAYHPLYAPGRASLRSGNRNEYVSITLTRGGTVKGCVTHGGTPVPLAVVYTEHPNQEGMEPFSVKTDHVGQYEIDGLMPGDVELVAILPVEVSRETDAQQQKSVQVVPNEITTADFEFPSTYGTLDGYISLDGAPPKYAQITLRFWTEDNGEQVRQLKMGTDGYFQAEDLPSCAGVIEVMGGSQPYMGTKKRIGFELDDGGHTSRNVDLGQGATIEGTALGLDASEVAVVLAYEGEVAFESFTMQLFWKLQPRLGGATYVARETSSYRLAGLEPGAYTLVSAGNIVVGSPTGFADARIATTTVDLAEEDHLVVDFDLR